MFNQLTAMGYGIVIFAIIIGVGTIILMNFAGSTAHCAVDFNYNASTNLCQNTTTAATTATPTGTAYTNTNYLMGQLGQSGLAGWTPAIVAISVGLLFLGAFMIGGSNKKKY